MLPKDREAVIHRLAADLIENMATIWPRSRAWTAASLPPRFEPWTSSLLSARFDTMRGWPTKLHGQTIPVSAPDMHVYTRREPLGVIAAIVPWNFPSAKLASSWLRASLQAAPSYWKPAEQTPLSALFLAKLAIEAGLLRVCSTCFLASAKSQARLCRTPWRCEDRVHRL
jgi:acyl-CoA reductase-like NAD-dependent aldehyde dehydrogenase